MPCRSQVWLSGLSAHCTCRRSFPDKLQEPSTRHRVGTIGRHFLEPKPLVRTLSLIHDWQRVQEDALVPRPASPSDDALHQRTATAGSTEAVPDEEPLHLADAPTPPMSRHAPRHPAIDSCHQQDTSGWDVVTHPAAPPTPGRSPETRGPRPPMPRTPLKSCCTSPMSAWLATWTSVTTSPRWTPQNRPFVDGSKPAISEPGSVRDRVMVYLAASC